MTGSFGGRPDINRVIPDIAARTGIGASELAEPILAVALIIGSIGHTHRLGRGNDLGRGTCLSLSAGGGPVGVGTKSCQQQLFDVGRQVTPANDSRP